VPGGVVRRLPGDETPAIEVPDDLVRVTAERPVLGLVRWKKSVTVRGGSSVPEIVKGLAVVAAPVIYRNRSRTAVANLGVARIPIDCTTVPLGVMARCPACGTVQRLE